MSERFEAHEVEPKNLEQENRERFEAFLKKTDSFDGTKNEDFKDSNWKYIVLDGAQYSDGQNLSVYKYSNIQEEKLSSSYILYLSVGDDFYLFAHDQGGRRKITLETPEQVKSVLDNFQKRFDQYEKILEERSKKEKKETEQKLKEASDLALTDLQNSVEQTA